MSDRRRFNVEDVTAALQVIAEFNRHDLGAIDLYQGGIKVEFAPAVIDRWKVTGLANKDFVELGMPDLNEPLLLDPSPR